MTEVGGAAAVGGRGPWQGGELTRRGACEDVVGKEMLCTSMAAVVTRADTSVRTQTVHLTCVPYRVCRLHRNKAEF